MHVVPICQIKNTVRSAHCYHRNVGNICIHGHTISDMCCYHSFYHSPVNPGEPQQLPTSATNEWPTISKPSTDADEL